MSVKKKALAVGILLSLLLVIGCKTDSGQLHQVASESWQNKLEMSLWINQDKLGPNDVLEVRVQVKNTAGEAVEYTMWNIGDPPIYTSIENPLGDTITLRAPEDPEIVQPAVTFDTLAPDETIERQVQWNVASALNGIYTLEASFFPGRQVEKPQPEPLKLTHEIQVAGSVDIIDSEEAQGIAKEHKSVQLWMKAHTGTAVGREQKGSYMVNLGGEWQSASQEMYEEALAAAESPSVSLLESLPEQWRILYASKFGFPPSDIAVTINARTGEITGVQPDLAGELQGGVLATFTVGTTEFCIFVTNPDTIDELLRLQQGESQANIPNGLLKRGPGKGLHNAPWSWHLDPEKTSMAEFTIEVCDGIPEFVEEDLDYWLNSVGQYCPWSAQLKEIEDYR